MATQCTQTTFAFHPLGQRKVSGSFDGGRITSDGGGLLLRETERIVRVIEQFAGCFTDFRDPERIEHTVEELVAQRIYGLAHGYEDLNDHDELRHDPLMAVLVGKKDPTGQDRQERRDRGKALAGKSTLNRLELTPADTGTRDRYKKIVIREQAVEQLFVDLFLQAHGKAPKRIVLDLDATDDPLHGNQEGRFFHGYYMNYCYLPLYIFCGEFLLGAKLRPANIDASDGAVDEVARMVRRIRQAWPKTNIVIRGDSGFCREPLMRWCEDEENVDFVLGLAKNARLTRRISKPLRKAQRRCRATGKPARSYKDFRYRTRESWSRSRRVVGKAEHLPRGSNPRFVVTSIPAKEIDAKTLYEVEYCGRGDMENRIKEQQLHLFADRTSTAQMRSNQIRLWFSSIAYALVQALRRLGLAGTRMAKAQCHTIRLQLLKIGALIRVTVRRVWVSWSESYPYKHLFAQVYAKLRRLRPVRLRI
ncbi:MAG TPA: IS1380 family transposase [Pseudomonadales bacterium]